jgi:hypothetical protein
VDLLGEPSGGREDKVLVKVELSRGEYEALKAIARREGYSLVSDYLRGLARDVIEGRVGRGAGEGEQAEALARRLERIVVDLLNPYTGKIDEIARRLADLVELVERSEVEKPREVSRERLKEVKRAPPTAIERLKEQGAVFQEDVQWMKSPERFFEKLKKEGAVVVSIGGERVALDPDFWARFEDEVGKISVGDLEEAVGLLEVALGEAAGRLLRKMAKAGMAVYDEDMGMWILKTPQ